MAFKRLQQLREVKGLKSDVMVAGGMVIWFVLFLEEFGGIIFLSYVANIASYLNGHLSISPMLSLATLQV